MNTFHKDKLTRVGRPGKEDMIMANIDMIPTRNHQINEDLLQLEKEFAGSIYLQRDWEKQ